MNDRFKLELLRSVVRICDTLVALSIFDIVTSLC